MEGHQDSAKDLLPLLDRRARAQPGMMVEAYESLLASIVRTEGAVFSHRPKVGLLTKARLAVRVMWSNLRRDDLSLS